MIKFGNKEIKENLMEYFYYEVMAIAKGTTFPLMHIGSIIVGQEGISRYWLEGDSRGSFECRPLGIQLFLIGYIWCLYKEDKNVFLMIVDEKFHSRFVKHTNEVSAFFNRWFADCFIPREDIFVYHYAHLKNAAGILNEQKIKCRKLATHDDQASQVIVHRKTEPHNYARFYFRPQTPYQFYTENLGREFPISIVEQYRFKNVEYPKCPVPIFIRLQLKEILIDKMVDCYVTDNNFHADDRNVRVMRVEEALNRFDFKGVYRKFENISRDDFSRELARYKKQVQQEFIVPKELDISKYEVEVICQSEQDKEALLNLLNEPHIWKERITVDYRNYSYDSYLRHNKKVWIEREGKKIVVQTEFMGKGELMIKSNKLENADGYLKGAPTEDTVIGYHYISAEVASESQPFDIFFIDESGKRWLIFSKN